MDIERSSPVSATTRRPALGSTARPAGEEKRAAVPYASFQPALLIPPASVEDTQAMAGDGEGTGEGLGIGVVLTLVLGNAAHSIRLTT